MCLYLSLSLFLSPFSLYIIYIYMYIYIYIVNICLHTHVSEQINLIDPTEKYSCTRCVTNKGDRTHDSDAISFLNYAFDNPCFLTLGLEIILGGKDTLSAKPSKQHLKYQPTTIQTSSKHHQHIIETPPKHHTIIQTSPTHHQNITTSSPMKKTSPSISSCPFRRHRRLFVRPFCSPSRRPPRRRPLNGKVFIQHTSHCMYLASFALVVHFG